MPVCDLLSSSFQGPHFSYTAGGYAPLAALSSMMLAGGGGSPGAAPPAARFSTAPPPPPPPPAAPPAHCYGEYRVACQLGQLTGQLGLFIFQAGSDDRVNYIAQINETQQESDLWADEVRVVEQSASIKHRIMIMIYNIQSL